MALFDTIHNTITEHAMAVGAITVIKGTPTQLTKAIMEAIQNDLWEQRRQAQLDGWNQRGGTG